MVSRQSTDWARLGTTIEDGRTASRMWQVTSFRIWQVHDANDERRPPWADSGLQWHHRHAAAQPVRVPPPASAILERACAYQLSFRAHVELIHRLWGWVSCQLAFPVAMPVCTQVHASADQSADLARACDRQLVRPVPGRRRRLYPAGDGLVRAARPGSGREWGVDPQVRPRRSEPTDRPSPELNSTPCLLPSPSRLLARAATSLPLPYLCPALTARACTVGSSRRDAPFTRGATSRTRPSPGGGTAPTSAASISTATAATGIAFAVTYMPRL